MLLRRLGRLGPELIPIGLGTFSFSHAYGPADSAESLRTLDRALELGCTLLDTADSYGAGENEAWLGHALQGRRDKVVLGTKVGLVCDSTGKVIGRNGRPDYIRRSIDASLQRLRTDVLDLCTLHRVDPVVPIEESVGAIAEAVMQGKVRLLGLSEAQPEELLRAQEVHPVSALQSEFSLWTRDPEREMIGLCGRLGVAFLAFSPLGRGMFAGSPSSFSFSEGDFRSLLPRFQLGNLEKNLQLASDVRALGARRDATLSQIALAWVLRAGSHVFSIPGTRSRTHLEENMRALQLDLTPDEVAEIERIFTPDAVAGERYPDGSVFGPVPTHNTPQVN
jgi:aryl-alcohol dehydrogenase-like predicted oxidoreductase